MRGRQLACRMSLLLVFLNVTSGYLEDRTGHIYHGEIITPDQQVDTNWLSYGTEDDPTMQAARAWLAQQPQCRS